MLQQLLKVYHDKTVSLFKFIICQVVKNSVLKWDKASSSFCGWLLPSICDSLDLHFNLQPKG